MINVSIVDDESQLRQSIVTFINGSPGFHCLSAYGDAESALQGLMTERPDVILMDIRMAGMNGIECVERLKELLPEVQVVMLTVYEDPDQIFAALAAGASGYMLKRLTPARLLEAIKEVHEGGSPMSHSIARKVVASFQKTERMGGGQAELLSPREQTVLDCLTKGLAYKQIADQLGISVPTVRSYLRRIYEKLQVQTRSEAVARYMNS
jgi:DNA-binding NarL/FixJ family response regulator